MEDKAAAEALEIFEPLRERLPEALAAFRELRPEDLLGHVETCELCRRDFPLDPASAGGLSYGPWARADFGFYRTLWPAAKRSKPICDDCDWVICWALTVACKIAGTRLPDVKVAFADVLQIGGFVAEFLPSSPRRPRKLAQDFTIRVLSQLGVSDGQLAPLVEIDSYKRKPSDKSEVDYRRAYVKDRRKNSVFAASRWMRALPF